MRAFRLEKSSLVPRSAERVVAEVAVAPHHAVAGDQDGHRVLRERRPGRPHGFGVTDLARDPAVRPDLAAGDLERLPKNRLLELRQAPQVEAQVRVARAQPSGDHGADAGGDATDIRLDRAPRPALERPLEVPGGARPRYHRDPGPAVRDEDPADRGLDPPVCVAEADPLQHRRQKRAGRSLARQRGQGSGDRESLRGGRFRVRLHDLDLVARRESVIARRSRLTARWTFDFAVPSGCFRIVATSSSRSPSM